MSEREHTPKSPEQAPSPETAEVAGERLKQLEKRGGEQIDESSQERAAEHARKEAGLEAAFSQDVGKEQRQASEPDAPTIQASGKKQKQVEYKKTMQSVQADLSKPSRAFSKVIHTAAIEKASDTMGATVARPNAILAGSFTAFIAVLAVYLIARYIGFRLSGFETIAAFIIGWVVGMALDGLRVAFSRHRAL